MHLLNLKKKKKGTKLLKVFRILGHLIFLKHEIHYTVKPNTVVYGSLSLLVLCTTQQTSDLLLSPSQLTQHYHPSVQAFAKRLAEVSVYKLNQSSSCILYYQGEHIVYKGDPLQDFTTAKYEQHNKMLQLNFCIVRFLDKFVYKNPKQKKSGNPIPHTGLYCITVCNIIRSRWLHNAGIKLCDFQFGWQFYFCSLHRNIQERRFHVRKSVCQNYDL